MAKIDYSDAMKQQPVRTVRVVCRNLTTLTTSPHICYAHWIVYLLLDGNQSVRLDMTPKDFDITRGKLHVTAYSHQLTNNSVKHFDFGCIATVTPEQFETFIKDGPLGRFEFNREVMGCRHWVHTAIGRFQDKGWLASDAYEQLDLVINRSYRSDGTSRPHPYEKGEFY